MLELHNVSVTLGKKRILSDISFAVRPQRIVALLGKNGSGKTTLLRAACGDLRFEGDICLDGTPIGELTPRMRALRMAYLPQTPAAPAMRVIDMVSLGRLPHISPLSRLAEDDRDAVLRAMQETDVLSLAERAVRELSGGERQRAPLAMALCQGAPLLLLDEPTTYLDTDARRGFLTLLSRLVRAEKKAALCVLHDLNDAIRMADDIALLADGRTVFFGSVSAFIDSGLAKTHFGLTPHATDDQFPFYY